MPYICFCKDHPNSVSLRKEHTQAHLRYIETILEKILVAGPVCDPDSGDYNSSCFIYQVETREEALGLLHNDPYYIAGIYKDIHCQPFRPAAGTWIGGKTW